MPTWKQIATEADTTKILSDVSADGSAAGQVLIYNLSGTTYTPALITGGTNITVTNTDAGIEIINDLSADGNDDVSNANLLTALAALESAGDGADENITIGTDAGDTIVITGNLTVSGTTTTINTATLDVEDNVVTLCSGQTGTPGLDSGIEIERGSSANKCLYFDESLDQWCFYEGSIASGVGNTTPDSQINQFTTETTTLEPVVSSLAGEGIGNIVWNTTDSKLYIRVS
jgi:hypothetical protein